MIIIKRLSSIPSLPRLTLVGVLLFITQEMCRGRSLTYNQAIKLNPQDARLTLTWVMPVGLGDLSGAIADFNQAIKINPQDAQSYYNRVLSVLSRKTCQGR